VSSMNALLEGMTPRQSQAVQHYGTPTAITAGAGAGKTRVLTTRIAKALYETKNPSGIVAITFTSDAAQEIRSRVKAMVGSELASKPAISTFHSFAMQYILAANWGCDYLKSLGCTSPTFRIEYSNLTLDHLRQSAISNALTGEQSSALKKRVEHPKKDFTSWLTLTRSYGYIPTTYFDDLKTSFSSLDDLVGFSEKLTNEHCEQDEEKNHYFLKCWYHYDKLLSERQCIDFDQVLVFSMMLLENNPDIRKKLKKRFTTFLVDEFQDTNVCQYRLLLQMVGRGKGFSMFGDIKQAIYGFRGSSCYLMANIEAQFEDITIINLPDNFRSTVNVVAAGNRIAESMGVQLVKEPMEAHKESSVFPTYRQFKGESYEAQWVCDKILELKGQGIEPQDIGILYRFNRVGQGLENHLINRNIQYRRLGSDDGLYDEPEIKDIVIFLHLAFHPFSPKVLNFLFSMFPQFAVSPSILSDVFRSLDKNQFGAVNSHVALTKILNDKLCKEATIPQFKELIELVVELSGLIAPINTFDDYCRTNNKQYANMDAAYCREVEKELGDRFWESRQKAVSDLRVAYLTKFRALFGVCGNYGTRTGKELAIKNFDLIFSGSFDAPLPESNLRNYIATRPLLDNIKKKNGEDENTTDVELMTIHASKGLEKRAIFVVGASEQQWWRDPNTPNNTDAYEEELRLFYVALTRAIEHLNFTFAATRVYQQQVQRCYPLRFGQLLGDTTHYFDHCPTLPAKVESTQSFEESILDDEHDDGNEE